MWKPTRREPWPGFGSRSAWRLMRWVIRLAKPTRHCWTPEQATADTELLQRWAHEYPATQYPDSGARERIAAKLEEMAWRMQSGEEGHEPEDAA
jgi:hypothetical protein